MNKNSVFHLLVVEDDLMIVNSLKLILPTNWKMTHLTMLTKEIENTFFHAAFIDMHLSGSTKVAEGLEVIKQILRVNSKIEIIAISGNLSRELMESCLQAGANKFLAKPLLPDEVIANLEKIEALWQIRTMDSKGNYKQNLWVGDSAASMNLKRSIANLKGELGCILIEGETGTGKEVVFRMLNAQEGNRPFIAVNIAAIPENLFESEMFGHAKGSFTGADTMKIGLAEAAHGGDLFLDEIEALPLTQQVKLLRFLESGEVRKVGAKDSVFVKTRVIIASNKNLNQLCKEGLFREDLLFRISGKKLSLPSLSKRKEDIPELAKYFMQMQRPRTNKIFSEEALVVMKNYSWPGNVRELKRICEQVALLSPLPIIRAEDVQKLFSTESKDETEDFSIGLNVLLEKYEAFVIKSVLKNISDIEQAAAALKISRSSLYQKIKSYNLQEQI